MVTVRCSSFSIFLSDLTNEHIPIFIYYIYINYFFFTDRRRSNVVKEIDRLKQNREARRAKQAEILEEKVTKQSIDPGNPNWEFLTMIRDYQEQLEYNPLQEGDDWIG